MLSFHSWGEKDGAKEPHRTKKQKRRRKKEGRGEWKAPFWLAVTHIHLPSFSGARSLLATGSLCERIPRSAKGKAHVRGGEGGEGRWQRDRKREVWTGGHWTAPPPPPPPPPPPEGLLLLETGAQWIPPDPQGRTHDCTARSNERSNKILYPTESTNTTTQKHLVVTWFYFEQCDLSLFS